MGDIVEQLQLVFHHTSLAFAAITVIAFNFAS
jgi:hypothetical protein